MLFSDKGVYMIQLNHTTVVDNTVGIFKQNDNHKYFLAPTENIENLIDNFSPHCQVISFQKGPIKENGVNGITEATMIQILIDRFEYFQSGNFPCEENEEILKKLNNILDLINKRTIDRKQRKVEGYNKK